MTRQDTTNSDILKIITPAMQQAVDQLAIGATATAVATAAQVTRQTVSG